MKKSYIIQDGKNLFNIISFDSEKSLNSYLKKFGFEFMQNRETRYSETCILGKIKDIGDIIKPSEREIYVRKIETYRY